MGEKSQSEEPVVSPQTYKNNCFHVPESLAGPSDRGRMMYSKEDGWVRGELARGNPREEIREQYRSVVTQLCSAAGSGNQNPPALSSLPKPRGRGKNPAIQTERSFFFFLLP